MKTTTTYILFFILIAMGGYILYVKKTPTENHTPISNEPAPLGTPENPLSASDLVNTAGPSAERETVSTETIVAYTNEGFTPAIITVPIGTTVVFENRSEQELWVISASHGSARTLTTLNQKKAFGEGGQYTFTFSQAGTYGFTNKLAPQKIGTIVVK